MTSHILIFISNNIVKLTSFNDSSVDPFVLPVCKILFANYDSFSFPILLLLFFA